VKRKKVVKILMGYGVSRNEANQMIMRCHLLGFSNRFAIGIYILSLPICITPERLRGLYGIMS
jgi:hypothetical protein